MVLLGIVTLGSGLLAFLKEILLSCLYATPPSKEPSLVPARPGTPSSPKRGRSPKPAASKRGKGASPSRKGARQMPSSPERQAANAELEAKQAKLAADAKARYNELLGAISRLQRWLRIRTWKRLLGAKIPTVRGPCGSIYIPVHSSKRQLIGIQGESRDYMGTSICCLAPDSCLRLIVISMLESRWFERISLVAIVTNCACCCCCCCCCCCSAACLSCYAYPLPCARAPRTPARRGYVPRCIAPGSPLATAALLHTSLVPPALVGHPPSALPLSVPHSYL